MDMRLRENADRGNKGQEKGNLLEALTEDNAWLVFDVRPGSRNWLAPWV